MNNNTYYLGIRHHGIGSSKRLLAVLEELKPKKVLIEGPSDCSDFMQWLTHREMIPPISLLSFATDKPELHYYYPFTEFSPEYQASLWAIKNNAEIVLIDIPISIKLAKDLEKSNDAIENKTEDLKENLQENDEKNIHSSKLFYDPIGVLAQLSSYKDGEDFWNDLFEENEINEENNNNLENNLAIFEAVAKAMTTLRQRQILENFNLLDDDLNNEEREAYMRTQIALEQKKLKQEFNNNENIVVICGAWHIPALDPKYQKQLFDKNNKAIEFNNKTDTNIIKQLPKKLPASKIKTTWIPWTSPRLAISQGYQAGVTAPMWYSHLWKNREKQNNTHNVSEWLTNIANNLRDQGQIVSTASVIEAVRLSHTLAAMRERPSIGFEEMKESAIACLCFGEKLLWEQIEDKLLLGSEVGTIPKELPLAPLLEDFQRLQKQTKLKAESLACEISLDLRSEMGEKKSLLLHRLNILDVNWGKQINNNRSRGTFREKWIIEWKPEYAVNLVENLIYGNTIHQAANNKLTEEIQKEVHLSRLIEQLQSALEANLPQATNIGLKQLNILATQTDDTHDLLASLPPLVNLQRYGTARTINLDQINELTRQLAIKASIALPYACRHINEEEANNFHQLIKNAHHALQLSEIDNDILELWFKSLVEITENEHNNPKIIGLAYRLLYQDKKISDKNLQNTLIKILSPAVETNYSASMFEGFFSGIANSLLYDSVLLKIVENWFLELKEDVFIEYLPLFRRVFSELDKIERKNLLEKILKDKAKQSKKYFISPENTRNWQNHLSVLSELFKNENRQ